MAISNMISKKCEKSDSREWVSVKDSLPAQEVRLYLVVQDDGETRSGSSAYYQQDGNGEWGFNKSNVTHWMDWPALPKAE
ncbi:DUF551 domain-containing protein [bacterium]|nr:DUF551 domain-containing protein [bacterium]